MKNLKSLTPVVLTLLFVVGWVFCLQGNAFAGTTGKVAGRITDAETGEPLPGVNVIIHGSTLGAATDLNGYYTILRVPPGRYSVEASMVGYKKLTKTDVIVNANLTASVDFQLAITVVAGETVVVKAERPMVIRDLTSSSTRVQAAEIEDIPGVNSVTDAITLMPGVIGDGEDIHVRGGRSGEVVYMIDGVAVNDALFNNEVINVNKYAIEEVELQTGGYNAEYGNIQSGVVNIVPRTGGQKYSGRIAYFTDDFGSGDFPADILSSLSPNERVALDPRKTFKPRGTGLRANSFNTDRWEFNLGGPEPLTNAILPALGLKSLKNKVTFFLSATAEMSDGYLPNENQDADPTHFDETFQKAQDIQEPGEAPVTTFSNPRKVGHPFKSDFLGLFDFGGRFSNNLTLSATVNYNPGANYKASVSFVGSKFWQDDYRHTYKFQPTHTQQFEGDNTSTVFNWVHNLSSKTFYQFKFGYLRNTRVQYPGIRNGIRLTPVFMNNRIEGLAGVDPDLLGDGDGDDEFFNDAFFAEHPEYEPFRDQLSGFFRTGYNGDSTWSTHKTQTYTVKLDALSQVNRFNEVKGGFEWKFNNLKQQRIDFGGNKAPQRRIDPPDDGPFITSGALRDFYDREPNTASAYLQDKIEFQSLVVNVGLRFDLFDPGSEVFETPSALLAEGEENQVVNDKTYLSPRLGISHPITDRSTLYFFYGRFVQIPTLSELYRRQNRFRIFQNQLNTFGNPDLKAEETTSYEVGFDHQLTDVWKIGVTGFFKTKDNQINLVTRGPEAAPFRELENTDFGTDRGFEIELIKQFSHYFAANINYTILWANTRSSSFDRGIGAQGVAAFPNLKEVPADWDQRHTVNANLTFEIPAGQGFRFLGTTVDRMGLNVFIRYGSGLPFTVDENADPTATENAERLPYFLTVDFRFRKDFRLVSNLLASFYVDVFNLFNRRNVSFLVADEQHSCIDCTLTDPVTGETTVKHFDHGNPAGNGTARDLNPEQFFAPRQILLGFGLRF
ncbi:MAG: TonB-dependent receptor domain-containing protein [bacterium]